MDGIQDALYWMVFPLYLLGTLIKNSKKVPDWTIVFILLAVAELAVTLTMGFSLATAAQGLFITATAVFGNQVYKQLRERVGGGLISIDTDSENQGGDIDVNSQI